MEQARTLEPAVAGDESPLAHARLHLQLTVDEAARRANISTRRGIFDRPTTRPLGT